MKIQVYKKGSIPHYNWVSYKIFEDNNGLICYNQGPRDLNHQTRKKVFTFNTDVIEYYWFKSRFSLYVALNKEENSLHYYANIHDIPHIREDLLSFVDYDLDVIRLDTAPAHIVDQDEFLIHGKLYNYSDKVKKTVPLTADFVTALLDEDPLFQKRTQLDTFKRIERGERDFLGQWTSHPSVTGFSVTDIRAE